MAHSTNSKSRKIAVWVFSPLVKVLDHLQWALDEGDGIAQHWQSCAHPWRGVGRVAIQEDRGQCDRSSDCSCNCPNILAQQRLHYCSHCVPSLTVSCDDTNERGGASFETISPLQDLGLAYGGLPPVEHGQRVANREHKPNLATACTTLCKSQHNRVHRYEAVH
jgi:hypothetical protein